MILSICDKMFRAFVIIHYNIVVSQIRISLHLYDQRPHIYRATAQLFWFNRFVVCMAFFLLFFHFIRAIHKVLQTHADFCTNNNNIVSMIVFTAVKKEEKKYFKYTTS